MNHLQTFTFDGRAVRIVLGQDGEPWWIATEVGPILGLATDGHRTTRALDNDEKGLLTVETPGGPQEVVGINESGLYSLILKSRKPEAKAFKRWVTHEVIPAIRKTGSYSVRTMSPAEQLLSQAQVLVDHERQIQVLQTKVDAIETRAQEAADALAALPEPLVHPADLTTRAKVNRLVREHCFKTGMDHREAWGWLYREFRDRYHFDLVERAKHRGLKPLEVAELEGQLENVYAVAHQIFRLAA